LRDRSDQDRHSDTFRLLGVTLHHSPPRRDYATRVVGWLSGRRSPDGRLDPAGIMSG
jgi:hypothetical protein